MDWQHAPLHRTADPGFYFITAGTYLKKHFLIDTSRRDSFIDLLLSVGSKLGVVVQDWVVLSNHYHLMIEALRKSAVSAFIGRVHSINAHQLNVIDKAQGRKVWYQYWDKFITHERSYLARLNYIHQNPVHHGIVSRAENYKWSSVRVFQERVDAALAKAVRNFKIDNLRVPDDF
ncbi:MAG TPA: transposase [Thermoanaerobaculia bacterium]|nr:transposase [Thermoanaerobaculia bacterium]